MIRRLLVLVLILIPSISASSSVRFTHFANRERCWQEHQAWVTYVLNKMETVKPGMTREELLKVFTTEGGFSTALNRRFVGRDCPYFKVDVEFKAVGRPDRDGDGRVTLQENSLDIIVKISRPYLQFSIGD
jgi:hypothetical protein